MKKGWKPFYSQKFRGKWKKRIPRSRLQQNKRKLYQGNQQSPQENFARRNAASNQWEFHRDVTRHGQPKCTGDTQEIIYDNKLIAALNKQESETENTINREINELRMNIDNIKEEVTHDMENLRKKNETE
jgi:hypothetical protein